MVRIGVAEGILMCCFGVVGIGVGLSWVARLLGAC